MQTDRTPNQALQRTPGFGVQLPGAALVRPAQSRPVRPAMKPGTARAFASRRRAHTRAAGPESLSLGSLGHSMPPYKMNPTFSAIILAVLFSSSVSCTNGGYSTERYMSFHIGVEHAARELSKGNFVSVSQSPSHFGWSRGIAVFRGTKPKQLRDDITFEQYLTKKYGIKYHVLSHTNSDYVSGYTAVMTAALRERYGDDYFERARHEFFPDVSEYDFFNGR